MELQNPNKNVRSQQQVMAQAHSETKFAQKPQVRGVYALFDPTQRSTWLDDLSQLADIGVAWFQLRAKTATTQDRIGWLGALEAIGLTQQTIVNDDVDAARQGQAAGVHLGPKDMLAAEARRRLGPNAIIGVSGDDPGWAKQLDPNVIDYIGCGTYRTTSTKPNAGQPIGQAGLAHVCSVSLVPVIAIGGLLPSDAPDVVAAGAVGMAVYGTIWRSDAPTRMAEQMVSAWRQATQ